MKTTTEIEVLNPTASPPQAPTPDPSPDEAEDSDNELPVLTPSLAGFSQIPVGQYAQSFEYIQKHRDVVVDGAVDALLVAAFESERAGDSKHAKQCIHQGLLLQYGEKLGPDGVRLFFQKCVTFTRLSYAK